MRGKAPFRWKGGEEVMMRWFLAGWLALASLFAGADLVPDGKPQGETNRSAFDVPALEPDGEPG